MSQLVISKWSGLIVQTDNDWHLMGNYPEFFSGTVVFSPDGCDMKPGDYSSRFIIERFMTYEQEIPVKPQN